ncbi:29943_t:CDS:2, partial [Gigaspora margarita]
QNWVLASLYPIYSQIPLEVWDSTPNNTNVSKSCHAKINRYGTILNLRIAIERLDDSKTFHSIETHNKSVLHYMDLIMELYQEQKNLLKKLVITSKNRDSSINIEEDLDKMECQIAL